MSTENARALEQFFEKLIERGLQYKEGLLFIVDGSKGIMKAIEKIFPCAVIQRCHYHKIENVASYLPYPKGCRGYGVLRLEPRTNRHGMKQQNAL